MALVTRNRPEALERALRSLRRQSEQPYEVIVSDDSVEEHQQSVRDLAARFDCQYQAGPRRGLYANRNAAALACNGSHIRTVDDDHTFPDGHLAACSAAVHENCHAVWIIGECDPKLPGSSQYTPPGQLHPRGFAFAPPPDQPMWAIADGATVYPREVFDLGNRFYEGFPFGASYLEWGSRLHWLGYDIRLLSTTFVFHHAIERSFDNPYLDTVSSLFAGMCHSLIYQPTWRNRALITAQFAAVAGRMKTQGIRAVVDGTRAFRAHQRDIAGIRSRRTALIGETAMTRPLIDDRPQSSDG